MKRCLRGKSGTRFTSYRNANRLYVVSLPHIVAHLVMRGSRVAECAPILRHYFERGTDDGFRGLQRDGWNVWRVG